jgi:hypothetical protein
MPETTFEFESDLRKYDVTAVGNDGDFESLLLDPQEEHGQIILVSEGQPTDEAGDMFLLNGQVRAAAAVHLWEEASKG